MFTIVATYGIPFDSEMELREFPGGYMIKQGLGYEASFQISILFIVCTSLSFVEYLISFLLASVHLMWTEALSPEDAKEYVEVNSLAPAAPVMWLVCGAFWNIIATVLLYYYAHPFAWVALLVVAVGAVYFANEVRITSAWAPKRKTLEIQTHEKQVQSEIQTDFLV